MAFAILRTKKLKTWSSISGSAMHTFRDIETPNADPKRASLNVNLKASSSKQVLALYRERMPEKVRKNAVLGIEYLITASPEAFKEGVNPSKYFNEGLKWLYAKHGEENVISAHVHRDETTPHLVAYVIPLDERGKLNARKFLGGRKVLSDMQTDFHQQVGEHFGLKRGVKGSKAKHKTIKQFYAELNKSVAKGKQEPLRASDRLLSVFGFKTTRVKQLEAAAELSGINALNLELEKKRVDNKISDLELAKQELLELQAESGDELASLKLAKMELEREKRQVLSLAEQTKKELESFKGEKFELRGKVNSLETLNKRLSMELTKVIKELDDERFSNAHHHNDNLRR